MKNAGNILWKQLEEEADRLEERAGNLVLEEPGGEEDPEELYRDLMARIKDRTEEAITPSEPAAGRFFRMHGSRKKRKNL